jgi:hypothetical protein
MHRYKHIYRIVQSIFITVTAALLLFILLPIWLYSEKADSDVTYSQVGKEAITQGESWLADYYKMNRSSREDGDILFFRDAGAVDAASENHLIGKAAVFEMLFSQETMNADTKNRIEYLTGATYSGFWGKTFEDLSDREAVPTRLIAGYEKNSGSEWKFRGEGIILTDGDKTIVLRQGKDYKGRMHFHRGNEEMAYYGHFEITSGPGPYAGEFSLKLTGQGKEAFQANGLPSRFPAIYKLSHNQYDGYYFAGDFSQLTSRSLMPMKPCRGCLGTKGSMNGIKTKKFTGRHTFRSSAI